MKNFTNNFKQFTSRLSARWLIMALMMLVGTSSAWADNITGGITFYLKPNNVFDKEGNPWFAIYLCNGTAESKWIKMTQVTGESGLYEATVPDTGDKYHANVIFCRMNPSCTDLKWDCRWNQTADLTYSNNKNLFTVTGWSNSQGTGNWSQKTLYYLMGLTDWVHGDNLSSSVSKYLAVGTHNFKVRDSQGNWFGNNGTMTRNGTSVQSGGWTMETGKNNCKITADVAGNYTFTFNSTTKKLTVTYPDLPCYTTSDVDPGAISSNATNNVICGSGSVKLTLSNTTTKDDLTRTIQWQKYIGNEWSDIINATSTTYTETISATTTYRAKVKWEKSECDDLIEYASESGFTITVNALPSAPALNVPEGKVCAGDLILDDYIDDSETNTVNWYTNSDCAEPATNPNLEPSVEKTFYAKSKDGNNCISSGYSELTLTSYALPSDFTVSVSDDEVCSGEDVTINIEGRDIGVDYELENEVIPAEGITVNPTKNTTYSVIASLSECQNMTKTEESEQITVNGTTITQSPEVVHPYEVVTFTAGEQATWAIHNNPSSGGAFESETYTGKTTAYITKGASQSTTFKGEAASGYVIRATVGDCSTDKSFDVVADPECE